jgi:hypothetical protein
MLPLGCVNHAEDDPELAAAIAASLQDAGGAGRGPTGPSYAAIAAAAAAAGGAGHHHTGSDGPPSVDGSWQMVGGEDEEDPELAQALALSMEEAQRAAGSQQQTRGTPPPGSSSSRQATPAAEQQQQAGASSGAAGTPPPPAPQVSVPEEPPEGGQGVLSLALRLPSGQRCCRRFLSLHTVGEVAAYAAQEAGLAGSQRVSLSTAFPVQVRGWYAGWRHTLPSGCMQPPPVRGSLAQACTGTMPHTSENAPRPSRCMPDDGRGTMTCKGAGPTDTLLGGGRRRVTTSAATSAAKAHTLRNLNATKVPCHTFACVAGQLLRHGAELMGVYILLCCTGAVGPCSHPGECWHHRPQHADCAAGLGGERWNGSERCSYQVPRMPSTCTCGGVHMVARQYRLLGAAHGAKG